ncbi:hypothetical protein ACLKA6_014290 [Drosophila palustris]
MVLKLSQKFENGSYRYEDVLIPKEQVGEYDYQILFNGDEESVPNHIRGCACKFKTCIRFCCHPQKLLLEDEASCEDVVNNLNYSTVLNITLNNGTQIEKNVIEFMVQQHLPVPCDSHLYLDDLDINQSWTLFENGTLLRHFDGRELSKRDYCLQPQKLDGNYIQLMPHHCLETELTNNYTFLGYYTMIATFLWLLIINYNLWKTFNNIGVGRKSRFLHYNIFVWGVAAVLLVITGLVELIYKDDDMIWKPDIGSLGCWINTSSWSAMIYYYGPIALLLIFNTTLFIKTAVRIFVQNRKNRRQLKKMEGQRNLKNLTNFGMFFRLFVIMGVIWSLEIASYVWSMIDDMSTGITFADVLTSGQGILLFAVTILKRDVLKSLKDRFLKRKSQNDASMFSQLPTTEISLTTKAQKSSTNGTEET